MAEINTKQIGFYKDGNWHVLNDGNYVAFNTGLILVVTGVSSSNIENCFIDDFETTVEALSNNKVLLISDNTLVSSNYNCIPILSSYYSKNDKKLSIVFIIHSVIGASNPTLFLIEIANNNGTLSCTKRSVVSIS
jgi:hypothetical protein